MSPQYQPTSRDAIRAISEESVKPFTVGAARRSYFGSVGEDPSSPAAHMRPPEWVQLVAKRYVWVSLVGFVSVGFIDKRANCAKT